MEFIVNNEDLLNGIKVVEHATSFRGIQPVLANILIETVGDNSLKLSATDSSDLTIITKINAQIKEEGSITLPAKKLSDIVSRLSNGLIDFNIDLDTNIANITSKNSKFSVIGISASEFPVVSEWENSEETPVEIDIKIFDNAIKEVGYAAANNDSIANTLSAVVFNITDGVLEMASTDGNRLARVREKVQQQGLSSQLLIPAKTLQIFSKIIPFIQDDNVKLYVNKTKVLIKSETISVISSLVSGQYPKYNQLIPETSPKEAIVPIKPLISALERVAVMVSEKTNIVKFVFTENKLILSANTPESGTSEDVIDIQYSSEELVIAFNYTYVLAAVKNMTSDEIKIALNTPLSATIIRPNNDDDYISLIMPVQLRN